MGSTRPRDTDRLEAPAAGRQQEAADHAIAGIEETWPGMRPATAASRSAGAQARRNAERVRSRSVPAASNGRPSSRPIGIRHPKHAGFADGNRAIIPSKWCRAWRGGTARFSGFPLIAFSRQNVVPPRP